MSRYLFGDDVTFHQRLLKAQGLYGGALDGRWGRQTEAADREFTAATKAAVVAALLVWMAIVFLGRAIAYDVAVWGSLSPSA